MTGPPDVHGWVTTAVAAKRVGVIRSHISWLVRHGRLTGRKQGNRLWIEIASIDTYLGTTSPWVSAAQAAQIVGCRIGTIRRAVTAGHITRREPTNYAQPSLSRHSVEAFAPMWRARQEAKTQPAPEPDRGSGPPDETHEWLTTAQAARVLGISTNRVRQLALAERLPCTMVSSRRYYRRVDVDIKAAARAFKNQRESR